MRTPATVIHPKGCIVIVRTFLSPSDSLSFSKDQMWNVRLPFQKYQSSLLRGCKMRGGGVAAVDSHCWRCGLEANTWHQHFPSAVWQTAQRQQQPPAAAVRLLCFHWELWQSRVPPRPRLHLTGMIKAAGPASVLQLGIYLQLYTCKPTCLWLVGCFWSVWPCDSWSGGSNSLCKACMVVVGFQPGSKWI